MVQFDAADPQAECDPVWEPGCEDRDSKPAETTRITELTSELCEEAQTILRASTFRIRTDTDAPRGDWHWGEYIHLTEDLLTNGSNYDVKWVLAHEAGHEHYGNDDQEAANEFADNCLAEDVEPT